MVARVALQILCGLLFLVVIVCQTITEDNENETTTMIMTKAESSENGLDESDFNETIDYNVYRLKPDVNKYFKLSTTQTCGKDSNMRFFAIPHHEKHGRCDCDHFQCSRATLYSPKTQTCHLAWSKGPCAAGEWYTFNSEMKAVCKPNPCQTKENSTEEDKINYIFQDPLSLDTKCYEAGTQGYCQHPDERLMIAPLDPIPKCRNFTVCFPLSVPVQQHCIHANRFTYEGNCVNGTKVSN